MCCLTATTFVVLQIYFTLRFTLKWDQPLHCISSLETLSLGMASWMLRQCKRLWWQPVPCQICIQVCRIGIWDWCMWYQRSLHVALDMIYTLLTWGILEYVQAIWTILFCKQKQNRWQRNSQRGCLYLNGIVTKLDCKAKKCSEQHQHSDHANLMVQRCNLPGDWSWKRLDRCQLWPIQGGCCDPLQTALVASYLHPCHALSQKLKCDSSSFGRFCQAMLNTYLVCSVSSWDHQYALALDSAVQPMGYMCGTDNECGRTIIVSWSIRKLIQPGHE